MLCRQCKHLWYNIAYPGHPFPSRSAGGRVGSHTPALPGDSPAGCVRAHQPVGRSHPLTLSQAVMVGSTRTVPPGPWCIPYQRELGRAANQALSANCAGLLACGTTHNPSYLCIVACTPRVEGVRNPAATAPQRFSITQSRVFRHSTIGLT